MSEFSWSETWTIPQRNREQDRYRLLIRLSLCLLEAASRTVPTSPSIQTAVYPARSPIQQETKEHWETMGPDHDRMIVSLKESLMSSRIKRNRPRNEWESRRNRDRIEWIWPNHGKMPVALEESMGVDVGWGGGLASSARHAHSRLHHSHLHTPTATLPNWVTGEGPTLTAVHRSVRVRTRDAHSPGPNAGAGTALTMVHRLVRVRTWEEHSPSTNAGEGTALTMVHHLVRVKARDIG